MAFNAKQFERKKKRKIDPNAPPRPNLLSQDKKLREQHTTLEQLKHIVWEQQNEIKTLKSNYVNMQASMAQMIKFVNNLQNRTKR